MTETKTIHEAMLQVYNAIGYVQKTGKVEFGKTKYSYVSVDGMIDALRPHLIEAGLYAYPCSTKVVERSANHLLAEYTFRIVHAATGESIEVQALGEGMDAGDKGAYKCATGAFKYFMRQAFMLETGEDDPDKESSEAVVQKITHKEMSATYKLLMAELGEAESQEDIDTVALKAKASRAAIIQWDGGGAKGGKWDALAQYAEQRRGELRLKAEFPAPSTAKEPELTSTPPKRSFVPDPNTPDYFGDSLPENMS